MLLMIADLLDVERIALGKFHTELVTKDVIGPTRESIDSIRPLAQKLQVDLAARFPNSPVFAKIDKLRLIQVLSNLLSNALKFTPKGGKIEVSLKAEQEFLILTVKDTGPGIPLDRQEQIFERYAQLRKNDRRGLGLGLYICRKIVEAHGGKLWVESEPGKGSAFHFSLVLAHGVPDVSPP
jgi:signal transduction histidine kinase